MLNHIQKYLEKLLNTKLFAEEIYYLSSLPSEINTSEICGTKLAETVNNQHSKLLTTNLSLNNIY